MPYLSLSTPRTRAKMALFASAWLVLAFHPGGTRPIAAQSIVRGEIAGVVRDQFGSGVPSVGISVMPANSDAALFVESSRLGAFQISMLDAGAYDVLFEARGYIPSLVRGVTLRAGQLVGVNVTLTATATVPQAIDTVFAASVGPSRFGGGSGRWISQSELQAFPDPRQGLARIANLGIGMDEALGSEGLPGSLSVIVLDGLPFTPARHPLQAGAGNLPLFPRSGLAYVDLHRRTDVEWTGAAGGFVAAASRPASGVKTLEAFAGGSTDALWQSDAFSDLDKPGATSFWGEGSLHLPLDDSGTRLFIAVEGESTAMPRPSPLSEDFATRLVQARPPQEGVESTDLTAPWTGDLTALSALARVDWRTGSAADVAIRGSFSTVKETGSPFFGSDLAYGSTQAFDGTDLSLAASVLVEAHPLVTVEARAGLERSTREWSGPEGGTEASPIPATRFLESGVPMGAAPGLSGMVTRTSVVGTATGHYRDGPHWVKGGLNATFASHEFAHVYGSGGSYLFSDPESVATGEGALLQAGSPAPTTSFSVPEFGIFAQYRWEPAIGIHVTAGARYDRELLPTDDVPLNILLDSLTGINNRLLAETNGKISPRLSVSWDPAGNGRTVLEGTLGAQFGRVDPAALNEVMTLAGSVTHRRLVGSLGASWPSLPAGSGAAAGFRPTVAIFGPDLQAPRTARGTFGLSQRIGAGMVLHLTGTFRRTEFLLRRDDLNLASAPSGTLSDGRPTYGLLEQAGSVVAADPQSNRRFDNFGQVWALNPDGVSEYRGMTVAVEHAASAALDLFASYTFSKTEDNLVGAALGIPEAQLVPEVPSFSADAWEEGTSDFDVPHRIVAGMRVRFEFLEGTTLASTYRFRSGRPFTPGFAWGVDANGDGSAHNDPAFVPQNLGALSGENASCLSQDVGQVARRNGCRGPSIHAIDLQLSSGLFRVGGSVASLVVDLFNVLDAEMGSPESALLHVDPSGVVSRDPVSGVTAIPVTVNPDFGEVTRSFKPGRMIRVGFRVAMP